ncbi:hypothetical protein BDK88_4181 [Natrinema hispanicum]|uniref:Uncharacterized protein n=1 Tax=Natrinema hispanicum TaxID=392421 RepID=A0A482Y6K0_9EURY|nr:hypothetical protein BDK88_4181 [Natrinema hispanicum]
MIDTLRKTMFYLYGVPAYDVSGFWTTYQFTLIVQSITLAWLYNSTRGSVLRPMLYHSLGNLPALVSLSGRTSSRALEDAGNDERDDEYEHSEYQKQDGSQLRAEADGLCDAIGDGFRLCFDPVAGDASCSSADSCGDGRWWPTCFQCSRRT